MKLQIGKGLLRIFIIFYIGWVIYYSIKEYNDYFGYIDAQTAWWKNNKEFNLKYAKEAKERGDEAEYLVLSSRAIRSDYQLRDALEGWKQAQIDGIWDMLGVIFIGPFIYGIPIAILYWILRFILKGFVKNE